MAVSSHVFYCDRAFGIVFVRVSSAGVFQEYDTGDDG